MKRLLVVFFVLTIAGCTSVRSEYIQPECYIPALPTLPTIDGGELFDRIGPDDYYTLSLREKRIVDWALELESILIEVCK